MLSYNQSINLNQINTLEI